MSNGVVPPSGSPPVARLSPTPASSTIGVGESEAATMSLSVPPSPAPPPALVNKPSYLETPHARFLIMDAPNDGNVAAYIDVLRKRQVVAVARFCDPTYSPAPLLAAGIKVLDIPFPDGDPPPAPVVDRWLALVDQVFKHNGLDVSGATGLELKVAGVEKPTIACHCVAGLGRAPVMVAIALMEQGQNPFDAIAFIRKKRRGAINSRQLKFIEAYQPRSKAGGCCTIQ